MRKVTHEGVGDWRVDLAEEHIVQKLLKTKQFGGLSDTTEEVKQDD